jgi:FAD dependent oxidoreductase TIGR03364
MTSAPGVEVDLVVVGAGIVGLAHAVEASARGLSVAIVERDERATGASVRNFGHGCFTAQSGIARQYAMHARRTWLRLAREAGLWLREGGAMVVARAEDELAVLAELAGQRDGEVVLQDKSRLAELAPSVSGALGGALLPMDVRVDPRTAVAGIATWLADRGVPTHWGTTVHEITGVGVRTSRGVVRGHRVVVAIGHDVDRLFPELATKAELRRCALAMLRVAAPTPSTVDPAVLTGWAMLRYGAFADCPTLPAVRARLTREHPDLVGAGLNLMFTQTPDGDLLIGDTHRYQHTLDPFNDERLDDAVLDQTARLLGVQRLTVRERWRGVYASAPEPFLVDAPAEGVRVVSVTSGVGMTTAFGLAADVLDNLL